MTSLLAHNNLNNIPQYLPTSLKELYEMVVASEFERTRAL